MRKTCIRIAVLLTVCATQAANSATLDWGGARVEPHKAIVPADAYPALRTATYRGETWGLFHHGGAKFDGASFSGVRFRANGPSDLTGSSLTQVAIAQLKDQRSFPVAPRPSASRLHEVPLPGGLPLFIAGLSALAILGKIKRNAVA